MSNGTKWKELASGLALLAAGFCIGITVKSHLDKDREIEIESLQEDSVYCGYIISEHGELEKIASFQDGRIGELLEEIEKINRANKFTDRFGYEIDSCSEDIDCCEDLRFVEAEWDVCLHELLSPGVYSVG